MIRTALAGAALPLAAALAGCVPYPIYKTLQPEARMQVVDAAERPVAGATVTLIANAYPYGFEKSRDVRPTDAAGFARFEGRSEWRAETFFIHGAEVFFWNWCVVRDGYVTHETELRSTPFDSDARVVLAEGVSTPCRPGKRLPPARTAP